MDNPLDNNTAELEKLLKAFLIISEATEKRSVGTAHFLLDAEGLAVKYFYHVLSALYLTKGTHFKHLNISYIDFSSINVLARTAMETFLVFDYIFIQPANKEEHEFRYLAWSLAGKLDKEKVVQSAKARKEEKKALKKEIEALRLSLEGNAVFQSKQDKKRANILKGNYRPQWNVLGDLAGLSKVNSFYLYKYLCSYAHASGYSINQIRTAHYNKEQEQMSRTAINLLVMVTALMAKRYMGLFSLNDDIFTNDNEILKCLNYFYRLGQIPMEEL